MNSKKAKLIRKGCNNKGQSRKEYQELKRQYKSLNNPVKRILTIKIKEAGMLKNRGQND